MSETAPFRPFETLLDEGRALASVRAAVAGADDGELFVERKRSEALMFDDGRIKTASYNASEGFGLRAVRGETAGYAHSTEISEAAAILVFFSWRGLAWTQTCKRPNVSLSTHARKEMQQAAPILAFSTTKAPAWCLT